LREAITGKNDGSWQFCVNLVELRLNLICCLVISQESTLFEDTLRFNLDPNSLYSDEDLLSILSKAEMTQFQHPEALDTMIHRNGENLSLGEKQLICICRAILRVS
jgi:ABC-type multidrug transport system fused ATPase/permease subunit